MHLSKGELKRHVTSHGLVSGYADLDGQLTANGMDVRLAAIVEVLDGGRLAVAKADNKPPKLGKAYVLRGFEDRLEGYAVTEKAILPSGPVKLDRLKPYLVITCEEVNAPAYLMFHIAPRSSLFRLTQSVLGVAFGEAGYRGFLTFMLLPFADSEIELGSRFAQLSFSELKGEARYEEQLESSYQGGKLF